MTDAIGAGAGTVHMTYDVAGPDGRQMPCTINTVAVCGSGVGKGTSYIGFFKPFYDFEAEHGSEDQECELLLQECSFRALAGALHGNGRNLSIQEEDGQGFLHSDLIKKHPDKLTQGWSGNPPIKYKVHRVSLSAREARCAFGMRIQPEIFYPFLIKTKLATVVQGLWPRAIAACYDPDNFHEPAVSLVPRAGGADLENFHKTVSSLLTRAEERARSGQLTREVLKLDKDATAFMLELKDRLRRWKKTEYADVHRAANRASENTLRLAAVFQVMCEGGGPIRVEMVYRAWEIIQWSLSQHRKIFVQAIAMEVNKSKAPKPARQIARPKKSRPAQHAQTLKDRIGEVSWKEGSDWVSVEKVELLSGLSPRALSTAWARLRFDGEVATKFLRSRLCVRLLGYPSQGTL